MDEGAYAGLRVLDLGQGVAAPYCAMLLAMHGAEVIKLEPLAGDWSRGLGMRYGDHTAMSAHYNRGKRSLALDLKARAAREIAVTLAARADIVIEGFRPGVAARSGSAMRRCARKTRGCFIFRSAALGRTVPILRCPAPIPWLRPSPG
jgi:crotonobetainyl-CoA:carnitine CoA-transferase CaiB-like acyl-CoA transferase